VLGDALRERAAKDTGLRESLARGEMAPEELVHELISAATSEGDELGLLVDGFPRHVEQLPLAQELFGNWTVIHLDLSASIAAARLGRRLICATCKSVKAPNREEMDVCPNCGDNDWQVRIEDEEGAVRHRMRESQSYLQNLLGALRGPRIIRLDAAQSADDVSELAVRELMVTRLS
jgi:adenylate kinase family enzyme